MTIKGKPTPEGRMDDTGLKLASNRREAACGICGRGSLVTPCLRCDALIDSWRSGGPVAARLPSCRCSVCKDRIDRSSKTGVCRPCQSHAQRKAGAERRTEIKRRYQAKRKKAKRAR